MHLFKRDLTDIDKHIRQKFNLNVKELPIVYFRKGDIVNLDGHEDKFTSKEHKRGYRSVHYSIETTTTKSTYTIELQVRTIFEEGWSEVDHNLLYPENVNDELLHQLSMILNTSSGSADSIADIMIALKQDRESTNKIHQEEIIELDKKISHLQKIINKSNLSDTEKEDVIKGLTDTNSLKIVERPSNIISNGHSANHSQSYFYFHFDSKNDD